MNADSHCANANDLLNVAFRWWKPFFNRLLGSKDIRRWKASRSGRVGPGRSVGSLKLRKLLRASERSERSEFFRSYLREKSEYSRPDPTRPDPTRPDPITLFNALYLGNRMSDRQAVFFDEHHLDVKVVWHGYHMQRQCWTWHVARAKLGVLWATPKTLYLNNCTTAGPIGLRLGIQLGTQQTIHVCGSFLGCFSTCARAHPASISRERLNRLRWYLACS